MKKLITVVLFLLCHPRFFLGCVPEEPLFANRHLQDLLAVFEISACASPAEIVAATQDSWLQKGKERWEFETRFEKLKDKLWPFFEKLGLLESVAPQKANYDYALVHGALFSTLKKRTDFLADLWRKGVRFREIVFLTGQRALQEQEKKQFPDLASERDLAAWVYAHSELPKDVPVRFVDAPMKQRRDGVWTRPQTSDTLLSWLATQPAPGSCLAISNQPYVGYQNAVAKRLLPNLFSLETVGPAPETPPSVDLLLDTLAKQLYEEFLRAPH